MRTLQLSVLAVLAVSLVLAAGASAAENLAVLTSFGHAGDARGDLQSPVDLTMDSARNVIVADTGNHRIEKFAPDASLVWVVGKVGTDGKPAVGNANGEFDHPKDVAVAPDGTILVADSDNRRVQRLRPDGTFLAAYELTFAPQSITVDTNGSFYMTDTGSNQVHRAGAGGTVNLSWGGTGEAPGQFRAPFDVSVASGFVYVADGNNQRVQKFNRDGGFVKLWGKKAADRENTKPGEFGQPLGISATPQGRVFVIDQDTARLDEFTTEGVPVLRYGDQRQLSRPGGVFALGDDVAVADTGNSRALRLIRTLTPPPGTFCEAATGSCSIGANGVPAITMPNGDRSPMRFVTPSDVCVRLGRGANLGKQAFFANRTYPVQRVAEGYLVQIDTESLPRSTKGSVILSSKCPAAAGASGWGRASQLSFSTVNETLGDAALVDPSGFVRDATTGRGIPDATVTLFSSAQTATGFGLADPLSISPRINPQRTDRRGHYGWDVPQGVYRISVKRFGYRPLAASRIVSVPPPVTNLHVRLRRNPFEQARLINPSGSVGALRLGMRRAAALRVLARLSPRPRLRFRAGRLVRIELRSARFKTGAGVGVGSREGALRLAFGRRVKRKGSTYRFGRASFVVRAANRATGKIRLIRVGS